MRQVFSCSIEAVSEIYRVIILLLSIGDWNYFSMVCYHCVCIIYKVCGDNTRGYLSLWLYYMVCADI